MTTKPRILFLVPSDYDSLNQKGVAQMILERDENGFFERVVTVHPITQKSQRIHLNDVHVLYEIGLDIIPGSKKYRILQYLQIPFHFVRVIWKVISLVKNEKISIIRATDAYYMGLFALIVSWLTKIPFCISIHADYDKRYQLNPKYSAPKILGSRKLAKCLERCVLSKAKMVMPIRQSLAQKAIINGARPETIRVIPHGIDMTPFKKPQKTDIYGYFDIGRNLKILSFVGRLSMDNYVDDILVLAKRLSHIRNDFVIVMAGGGNEEDRLKKTVTEDNDLSKVVRLVGFQSHEICLDLRRASEISLCLMAGFSLIEACAAGRPVVAYDVEWHSELVKDNETGFLIKEHDIESMVRAASFLLNNQEEAVRMGRNAQKLVFEEHDIKKTSEIKRRYYKELLGYK